MITYYRQPTMIQEAVDTAAALSSVAEVIVIDDGSPEAEALTRVLPPKPKVRVITQPNGGLTAARNRGLAEVTTEYVLFLDGDDWLLPEQGTNDLVAALDRAPEAAAAIGRCVQFLDGGVRKGNTSPPASEPVYPEVMVACPCWHPAQALYRTAIIRQFGGWRADADMSNDLDMYFRMFSKQRILAVDCLVSAYRIHDSNVSKNVARMLRSVSLAYSLHRRELPADPAVRATYRRGVDRSIGFFAENAWKAAVHAVRVGGQRRTVPKIFSCLLRYQPAWLMKRLCRAALGKGPATQN